MNTIMEEEMGLLRGLKQELQLQVYCAPKLKSLRDKAV